MTGSRPPHLCTCGKTVEHNARCVCQQQQDRARKARHDVHRPTASARGYNHLWRKARLEFLAIRPTCKCGQPATLVDHIKAHRGNDRLFWDRSNWDALCTPCHSRTKQRQERAK